MHVPDGFLNLPASAGTGLLAATAVAGALRGARREFDERTAPMTGLVATFVFAGQMINFPVGAGTSGHLLGGAMAAMLVGPWTATLALTVVVIVQALLFADGGITALGTNITLVAVVGVWVGWSVFLVARRLLPATRTSMAVASAVAAFVSVPATAATFATLFLIGGTANTPAGPLFGSMVGVHLVIGLGEALITAAVVSTVMATRPDLVFAARPRSEVGW